MTHRRVPASTELFEIAMATREACARVLGTEEPVLSLLAVASFQLQSAHVGSQMAAMANDPVDTPALQILATDYTGVYYAALNLAVRCSVTVVDLCCAALGRLTKLNRRAVREWDAGDVGNIQLADLGPLQPLAEILIVQLSDPQWLAMEGARHLLTHNRPPPRTVHITGTATVRVGSEVQPPPPLREPKPMADPQQSDIEWNGKMTAVDIVCHQATDFAEETLRRFCGVLIAIP